VLLKERDKALTLTTQEAVAVGLAIGIVTDSNHIGGQLKLNEWIEAKDSASKNAQLAHRAAEESTRELDRLSDVITKALQAPIGGTQAALVRQLADHKAARIAATRFQKVVDASPYYKSMIDGGSLNLAIREIDRRLTLIEALIERERKRK